MAYSKKDLEGYLNEVFESEDLPSANKQVLKLAVYISRMWAPVDPAKDVNKRSRIPVVAAIYEYPSSYIVVLPSIAVAREIIPKP